MKLYFKISKFKFYVILFLILLIPVSKKYRLFLFGIRTEGIAVGYGETRSKSGLPASFDYTLFRFDTQKGSFEIRGPENFIYKIGEKKKVIYDKRNPGKCIIPTFSYLYLTPNAVIPGLLLLLWIAFYTSFTTPEKRHTDHPGRSS